MPDGHVSDEDLRGWTAWHPGTPETMISSFAVLRLPPLPELLRGAFVVSLRFAYNGTAEDGERTRIDHNVAPAARSVTGRPGGAGRDQPSIMSGTTALE